MPPDDPVVPAENIDTTKPADIPPEDVKQADTAEELGGTIDEGGQFQPDFDSAIDAISKGLIEDEPEDGEPAKKKEAAAPVKTAEELAVEEEAKKTAVAPIEGEVKADQPRDADLKELEAKLDPHASPKTKAHFQAQAAKIIEARDRADAIAKEATEAKAALELARKGGLPKEVDEELKQLRDTVRELDATRDPALIAKYDKKISGNDDVIVKLLKENGLGIDEAGKEIPGVLDALKKVGLSRRTLETHIKALEKAGGNEAAAAEEIKDLLRENSRLGKDKEREIGELKSTYEQRQAQAQETQNKEIEAASKRMTDTFLKEVQKFDFLKEPPAVKAEDAPAIRKEKEKAIAAANERVLKFADAVKRETAAPIDAQIAARTGILYRDHVVPTLQGHIAARDATIAGLQAQIKALKGAGDLSTKTGSSAPKAAPKEDADPNADFGDAIDGMFKAAGVKRV